jgi:glutamate/aspartate transport system permease protein
MHYHWNWGIYWEQSPEGSGTYADLLLAGLEITLLTAALAWIIAFVVGSFIGILRTLPSPILRRIGSAWVELFRDIPLLVQLFIWFFVLPELLPGSLGIALKQLPNASFYTSVFGLGLYTSARVAEQVRAGINSLSRGQKMAATALGLTMGQTYRNVLLPLSYRIILPPLTSEVLNIIKNSSVALTIGLLELTARTRAMQEYSFQVFEAFTAATIIYLVVNFIVTHAMRSLEAAVAIPGTIGGK